MRVVLDSSAVLALVLDEDGGEAVFEALPRGLVSTVNLSEIVSVLVRGGNPQERVRTTLARLRLAAVPPDEAMAIDAGLLIEATRGAGLSLGDRFCLALARRVAAPVMTADRAWLKVAERLGTEVRVIR